VSLLILNRTPLAFVPYHKWLADCQEEVVLLTSTAGLSASYLESVKDFYTEIHTFDKYEANFNVEVVALELHQKYQFRKIIAISELDIIRAGRLREHLGIPGQNLSSAWIFRDKVMMKELAESQRIAVTPFKRLNSILDLLYFIEQHGFPVLVKPTTGAASIAINIIRDRVGLQKFCDLNSPALADVPLNLAVEKFVEGTMYHLDGIVVDGKVKVIWPSVYVNDCLSYQENQYLGSLLLAIDNPLTPRLLHFGRNLLHKFPTPDVCTFHIEVFHTPDDRLLLNEVASRTGGARVGEVLENSFGVHPNEAFVRYQCGLKLDNLENSDLSAPKILSGWLVMPPEKGVFKGSPATCPFNWIVDYSLTAELDKEYDFAQHSVDSIATFVLEGKTENELKGYIQQSATWFARETQWGQLT
jgi:biotin carboxylase